MNAFGQVLNDPVADSLAFIEVYVNDKGKVLLFKEKSSVVKLEDYLKTTRLKNAKLGTLIPTPFNIFPTVEEIYYLFIKYNINVKMYKDPELKLPAFD